MNEGKAMGFISSDIKEEVINTKNGEMKKIQFSIALNRKSKNGGVDYPWFEAFGKTAENIVRFFHKGKGILVEYHLQTGSYQNKEGKTVYTESKVIDSFEFPPIRKSDEQSASDSEATEISQNEVQEQTSEPPKKPESEWINIPDGIEQDLPFR